jgi:hypothetical protein
VNRNIVLINILQVKEHLCRAGGAGSESVAAVLGGELQTAATLESLITKDTAVCYFGHLSTWPKGQLP